MERAVPRCTLVQFHIFLGGRREGGGASQVPNTQTDVIGLCLFCPHYLVCVCVCVGVQFAALIKLPPFLPPPVPTGRTRLPPSTRLFIYNCIKIKKNENKKN